MIDIHSHILPKVDDGANNIHDSLLMAQIAVKEGIHTIFATPHHMNGTFINKKIDIISKVEKLNNEFTREALSLRVLPGQKPRLYEQLLYDYKQCEIVSLNDAGRYVLVEFPPNEVPAYTEKLLYELQMEGLTPIIANPERNKALTENPLILYQLVKKGALTQIMAASVVGKLGSSIRKFSLQLIQAELTHFIASNAYDVRTKRFYMAEAYETVKKKFGKDSMELFLFNAEQIVSNKHVHQEIPQKIKDKKLMGLF